MMLEHTDKAIYLKVVVGNFLNLSDRPKPDINGPESNTIVYCEKEQIINQKEQYYNYLFH